MITCYVVLQLGYTTCLAIIVFIRFYIGFLVYEHYYIIPAYILLYHSCFIPPISRCYHLISYMFPASYQLLYIYLFLHAGAHDTVFLCMFMIRICQHTCAYLCTPLGIRITTCWGVLTPLDSHVQVSELGL